MAYYYESKWKELTVRRFAKLHPTPHFHENFEVVYVQEGQAKVYVDFREYEISANDLFIAFPNQIHYYLDDVGCKGILAIAPTYIFEELQEVWSRFLPVNAVVRPLEERGDTATHLQKAADAAQENPLFRHIYVKGLLLAALAELFAVMEFEPVGRNNDTTVRSILQYCAHNYQKPLTLSVLEEELHISKYHISHIFTKKFKMSFNDFINTLRVEDACKRIRSGESITSTAFQSGFQSIRTFNRAFRQQKGITPQQYERERRRKKP